MNYRNLAVCGVLNLMVIVFVRAADVRIAQSFWWQRQQQTNQLTTDAAIEQTAAQQQAAIAQAYSQNQIAAPTHQFIIQGYSLNAQPPEGIDWGRTLDPRVSTQIFDQDRRCIGRYQGGTFYFIQDHPTICNP